MVLATRHLSLRISVLNNVLRQLWLLVGERPAFLSLLWTPTASTYSLLPELPMGQQLTPSQLPCPQCCTPACVFGVYLEWDLFGFSVYWVLLLLVCRWVDSHTGLSQTLSFTALEDDCHFWSKSSLDPPTELILHVPNSLNFKSHYPKHIFHTRWKIHSCE